MISDGLRAVKSCPAIFVKVSSADNIAFCLCVPKTRQSSLWSAWCIYTLTSNYLSYGSNGLLKLLAVVSFHKNSLVNPSKAFLLPFTCVASFAYRICCEWVLKRFFKNELKRNSVHCITPVFHKLSMFGLLLAVRILLVIADNFHW